MYSSPVKRVIGDGLCGLKNMGNTCYINGVIQCLSSFPVILQGLLQVAMDHRHCVSSSLRIFLDDMQQAASTYSYDVFLECVKASWVRYEDRTEQDPMEFFTYLMSTVHGEILEKHCTENKRLIDPNDVVGSVVTAWMSSEKSKVTYIFGLQTVRFTKCACSYESAVCDSPDFYFSLSLPEGKKACTLKDCLQLFRQESINTCVQCGEDSARSTLRLGRLPPVLAIHLVRFSQNPYGPGFIKNTCKVSYDHTIDLKDIFVKDLQENTNYSLRAVTDHTGQLHSGHVTAYCLRNDRWYHFDDAHVSVSSSRRAAPESAYILWYQQKLDHTFLDLDALSESILKRCSFPSHSLTINNQPSSESSLHPSPSPPSMDKSMASQAMEGEVVIPFPPPVTPPTDHNTPTDTTESVTFSEDFKVPDLNFTFFTAVPPQTEHIPYLQNDFNQSSSHNTYTPHKRQRVDIDMEDPLLTESDIPGVTLDIDKLDSQKKTRLEKWLRARKVPVLGSKAELIKRIRKHHAMGKGGVVDPSFEDGRWHEKKKREAWDKSGVHSDHPIPPMGAKVWKPFPSAHVPDGFSYYKILEYFEDIPACDFSPKTGVVGIKNDVPILHEESDSDEECHIQASQEMTFTDLCRRAVLKALMKGEQFVASGRVGAMEDTVKDNFYHIKAQVQASMELTLYIVQVCLEMESGNIRYVTCCCKTQNIHRCGHITAVLILLWRHVAMGNEAVTTTGRECYWRGGPAGRDPGFVSIKQYASHKWKINRRNTFNYLPSKLQQQEQMSMEELREFRNTVRKFIPSSLLMHHIGPLFESPTDIEVETEDLLLAAENCSRLIWSMNCRGKSKTGPFLLEGTEGQHLNQQWLQERKIRSTAFDSKVFLGLSSDSSKKRYIRQKIWGLDKFESQAMKDGRTLEPQARKLYEKELQEAFDPTAIIRETGSWSNTKCPTLSCSPDGLIEADLFLGEIVLFEAKYLSKSHVDPHSFEDYMTKEEAKKFYLQRLPSGNLQLKQSHTYYYQIQMALDIMEIEWCHLMVYTLTGFTIVVVQRNLPFWNEKRLRMIQRNRELVLPEIFLKRTLRHLPPKELVYSIFHEDSNDDYFKSH